MLDAPVYRDGEVVGVVCHEHLGGVRHWTDREIDFAGFVADMLRSFVEQATRLEMVAALREHQKLETLACVAGGVAHDFQNLLSVVLIHAARVHARSEDAAVARESSEEIRDAAEEGVRLTKRLQALIEQRAMRPTPVSLGEVAERMEPILRLLAPGAARFEVRRSTEFDEVVADPSELEDVLLGLVTSACDKLVDRDGVLSVIVRAPREDEAASGPSCVVLEVRVSGAGAGSSAEARGTEPLLPNKVAVAAGISLSAVRDLVARAHGSVHVASQPEQGATFTVLWPLVG